LAPTITPSWLGPDASEFEFEMHLPCSTGARDADFVRGCFLNGSYTGLGFPDPADHPAPSTGPRHSSSKLLATLVAFSILC